MRTFIYLHRHIFNQFHQSPVVLKVTKNRRMFKRNPHNPTNLLSPHLSHYFSDSHHFNSSPSNFAIDSRIINRGIRYMEKQGITWFYFWLAQGRRQKNISEGDIGPRILIFTYFRFVFYSTNSG